MTEIERLTKEIESLRAEIAALRAQLSAPVYIPSGWTNPPYVGTPAWWWSQPHTVTWTTTKGDWYVVH